MSDIASISANELKGRMDRGERLVLLDVREPEERAFCAIPVSSTTTDLHIPIGELTNRYAELSEANAVPLVIYCHLGMRSMAAARWLAAHGYSELHNLDGGIEAWSVEVDPNTARY